MAERTLLVTGGRGFVGRHLVELARLQGWNVVVPTRGDYDLHRAPSTELFNGITHVVHAAYVRTQPGVDAVGLNVNAARALLAAAGTRRCVFISSFSAAEDAPTAYGRQKASVEREFLQAGHAVLRLGLVLGEGGLAGAMARHIRRWRVVPLAGRGDQPVQTVHVDDAAQALLRVLERTGAETFDVAEAQAITFRALCEQLAATVGVRPVMVPMPWTALARTVEAVQRLGVPLPVSTDSIRGMTALRARDVAVSTEKLGLHVRTCAESLRALGADGLLGTGQR